MPEGDTVFHAAKLQNEALAGLVLTGFELRVPKFAAADLTGETVHEVVARGKHLLHRIGEWTLHSHLKMEGVVAPRARRTVGGRARRSRRARCCARHPSPRRIRARASPS